MQKIEVGNEVEWRWGCSKAEGKVARKFTENIERRIKGKTIKRKADEKEPVFLIEQESGANVLKSQSEVKRTDG